MTARRSLSAFALCVLVAGFSLQAQTRTDEYTRYELQAPSTKRLSK
jgi:hypothetical protein